MPTSSSTTMSAQVNRLVITHRTLRRICCGWQCWCFLSAPALTLQALRTGGDSSRLHPLLALHTRPTNSTRSLLSVASRSATTCALTRTRVTRSSACSTATNAGVPPPSRKVLKPRKARRATTHVQTTPTTFAEDTTRSRCTRSIEGLDGYTG